jgi:hypothetical protein
MKAISVRSPWWWFILQSGKDIENRNWSTKFRGTVLLHASKFWRRDDVLGDFQQGCDIQGLTGFVPGWPDIFAFIERNCGCIVGKVEIVDCISKSSSPWFFGDYGFVLRNPIAFPVSIPFTGKLGFFEVPDQLIPAEQS